MKAAEHAGHRVLSSEPSGSESDLSYARLSDLLADLLPEVTDTIPGPQREALEVALLLREAGERPPTAHAVGLAVLAALQAGAAQRPMLIGIATDFTASTVYLPRMPSGQLRRRARIRGGHHRGSHAGGCSAGRVGLGR